MSDCRIIIKKQEIVDFLKENGIGPEFESGKAFINTVRGLLEGKLVTYNYEGTVDSFVVSGVRYTVVDNVGYLTAYGFKPETNETDEAQVEILTSIEDYVLPEVGPETPTEDPDPATDEDFWNPVKLNASSTTRNDTLSDTELKNDDVNISQRKLIELVEQGKHQLIAVVNDGTLKGPEGVVLVAVASKDLAKISSQADAIRYAALQTGLTIEEWQRDENGQRLTTEIQLGQTYTVPVSSFFGTHNSDQFKARDLSTLARAVNIIVTRSKGKVSEAEAISMFINQLDRLQNARERAENNELVVLDIDEIGSASYPNGQIVLNKMSDLDIEVGKLLTGKEGFKIPLTLRGRTKVFTILPSKYTKEEIDWMFANFNNTSNPSVLKSYQLLLGRNLVTDKVIATDKGLIYVVDKTTTRPATLEDLNDSLLKYPYRQRSLLLLDDSVYYLGSKYNSRRYLLEKFVLPHRLWQQGGQITLDGANTAIQVVQTTMEQVIDPYTTLEEYIPAGMASEIFVSEGTEVRDGIVLDKNRPGVYFADKNTIYYTTPKALFEERVHAATVGFIRDNPDDEQVLRLKEIYESVKDFYNAKALHGKFPNANYSFTSVEEFIARAITDKDTMQVIAEYDKANKTETVVTQFLEFIKRVFNLLAPTVNEVFEIYQYMKSKSSTALDVGEFFSQEVTLDLNRTDDKLVYAQSMDYLFLQYIESKNVTLDAIRMAIARDPKRINEFTGSFRVWLLEQPGYDLIKQTLQDYTLAKAVWLGYSSALSQEKDQTENEDQSDLDTDENIKPDKEFRSGPSSLTESAAIADVDNEIKAILSTIPNPDKVNKLGIPSFYPYKDLYYEVLDRVNGYTSLSELLQILRDAGGKFAEIERRINKKTKIRFILLGKFHRSMNRYAVPFKILKQVNNKFAYIQVTGENLSKAEDLMNTNFYTSFGDLIGNDGAILPLYKTLVKNALDSKNYLELARLLGVDPQVIKDMPEFQEWADAQESESIRTRWDEALRATLYQPTDFKAFVAKPFKALATIYAQAQNIRKIRMAKTPDGNPIAAETIPNSLVEMVKLYRQLKKDEDGNIIIPDGIEYNFLRNPSFQYSHFKNAIDTIEVIYQGGFLEESTVDLDDQHWLFYSMFTMLTEGYGEFMRTETSSSSWGWRTLEYLSINPNDLVPIFTNYLRMDIQGYLNSKTGTEAYNAYRVKNSPSGASTLPSGVPNLLIFENFNLPVQTQEQLDNLTDEELRPIVEQFMLNLSQEAYQSVVTNDVGKMFTDDVIAQLPATLDTLEKITQVYALHDFIYHVEQTILFDGGIEYYKAYYKRAKGKISTGSNSIADPEYWDSLDPEQTIGGKLPPVLRVLNIKEPTEGYASGRFDGDIYIPGSPEFETIFQSQVDAAYRRKRMARLDVTREDVMREYLPKNAPYTDMKIGDGQGGINLDYLRAIQIGDGNWPEDAEATYQWEKLYYKVNYLGYTPSRTKQIRGMSEQAFYERGPQGIIPPVKYSYFGPSKELGHKPIFDKFSLFPMLPSMMKGTKMEDLTRQMIENKVAYFKYPSGTKAVITTSGPGSTVSLDNLDIAQSSAILTLSPRFLKEQEKVSFKNKVESIFGSQSRKLIFQDSMEMGVWVDFELTDKEYNQLFPDGAPDRVTYFNKVSNYMRSLKDQVYERSNFARRYRDYVNLMRRSMRLQHQQALTSMGLKEVRRSGIPIGYEISNPEEFAKILEKYNIDNNPAITDYVSMLKTGEGIPYIEFSSMSSEIRKTIGSIFRKKIATQKVHGQPLIMVSSANMTKIDWQKPDPSDYDKYGATGLRYYQVKDGQTMAAQIKTSYSTEFDSLKNNEYIMSLPGNTIREKLNEMLNRKEALDADKIERLRSEGMSNARQVVEAEHQMAIDFWNEHKESFTLFAKRIPTQGLSSMDVFEIREFLPESAGKILIPPLEIVAKAGSDFDIDKMYFFRPRLSKFTGKPLTDEPPIESVEAIDEQLRLIEMRLQPLLAEKKDLQKTVKALRVQMKDASDKNQIREIKSAIRNSTLTEAQKDELEELFTAKARLSGLREQVNLALDENKAVLQNKMLNVIKEQILDPLNYSNLTMPLGTGVIKAPLIKAAEQAFGKGVTDDKAGGENLTVKTHLLKRKSMLVAGKKLLGIAAVAVPGFQVQSKVRLLYSTSTAFSEGEVGALGLMAEPFYYNLLLAEKPYITESNVDASSMYSVDGVLKSEVLNQYVSAMVDAATENYAGFANHNFQTFPVAVFLVREGLPYQTIVDFMASRVMRELEASLGMSPLLLIGNKQSEIMSLISRSVPEESQARELYNQYILGAIAEVRQDPSVLYTRFKDMDLTLSKLLQDYILLGQYIIFKKKAGDSYHAQNMISVDTRPPKLVEDVTSINRPDDRVMADTAQRAIDQTELSAFNTRQMFVDILSSFFPALYNYQTITAFDTVTTALWTANRIKPEDLDLLRLRLPNEWAGFLFKNTTLQKGKAGVIAETLMAQIPNFYKTFKTDPVLRDTLLARDLKVFKVGNQMYTLGLVREAKDEIVEKIYYQELLAAYNDPKYTNLIKAIALVAMATTGYRKTFYSFTDILPPSILAPIFEITRLDYLKADQEALLKAFEDYMLNNYAPTGTPTYASGEVEYVSAVEYAQDEIPVLPEKAPGLLATQWSEIGPIIKEIQQRNGLFEFRVPLDTQVERGQKVVLRNSYATFVLHVTSVRRPSNTPGVRKGYSPFFYSNVSDYTSLAIVGTLESYEVNIPISETPMPGTREFRNPVRAGSGGAPGADFEFDKLIRAHGGVVVHYYLADDDKKPPYGNHPISDPGLIQEARTKAINASTTMWANPRENPGFKALNDKKIIRNWFQVKYHDAVVAVSTIGSAGEVWVQDKGKENPRIIIRDGVVQGGTGYAVEMAKNEGKPIYVFNAPTSDRSSKYPEGWYQWNHSTKQFDRIDKPPFLSNFAAIGSRSLSPAAKKAIKDYIQVLLDEPIQELKIDETDFTRPISFTYKGKQYQSLAHAVLSNVDGIFNQWVYDNYSDNLISEIGKVMNLPITSPSDQSISPEVPKLPDGRSMLDVWHLDIQGKRVLKVNQEVEVYIPLMEIQGEHGNLQEFLNALKRDYPAPTLRESYALFRKTNKVIVKDVENGFVYFDYKGYELEIPREFIEVKKTDKYSVAPANNLRINNLANAIYKERWKEHLINNYGAFLELKKQAFNPGFVRPSSPISNEAMLNSLFTAGLTLQGTDVQRLIEEITQSAMGQNPGNVPSNTVITPTNATAPLAKAMAPYTAPKSTTLNVYNKVQKADLLITNPFNLTEKEQRERNLLVAVNTGSKLHFDSFSTPITSEEDIAPDNPMPIVLNYIHWLTFMPVSPVEEDLIAQAKSVAEKNELTIKELNETPGEAAQVFLEGISTLGMTPQQSADYVRIWFKEKDRRQWIINQLRDGSLKGKQLVYFSDTEEITHADALKYLIDNAESFYPTLNSKNFDNSVRSLQAGAVVKFKDQQYIVGNISEGKAVLFSGDGTRYPTEVNGTELKVIGAYPMYDIGNRSFILYNDKVFNGLGEEVTNLETIQIVKASAKVTASPASQKELSKKLLDPNDKELKIGSVVEYKGERYLFARENAGRAQLIDINFVKSPGTPSPKNLKAIGSYPVVDYNNVDYIVVSRDMIFSTKSKNRVFQSQPNITDQLYSRAKLRQESPNAYKAYRPLSNELPELANYKSAIDAMIPSYNEFLGLVTGYVTSGKDGTRQQFIGKETPQSFISALNWNLTRVSELYQTLKSQVNQIKTLEDSNQVEAGTYDSVVALGRIMKQIENTVKEDSNLICRL